MSCTQVIQQYQMVDTMMSTDKYPAPTTPAPVSAPAPAPVPVSAPVSALPAKYVVTSDTDAVYVDGVPVCIL